ncbi:MAG: Stk1 family PASTA domain-containing Ser/Thr kinase [Ruminococcus sp.]|nr:Stk1 family PASTA domain-containing Ser/Thr kinase [Ruminococcus sp.]
MDKNIGKKLDGRYEITELIGVGGMAEVYKGIDVIDNKTVAIKILKKEYAENEEFLRRFRNESKAIAVLSHPNIVRIYDVGFSEKIQYIVMEYIDGITLKEYIEEEKILTWKDTVHFVIQILRALQHAHDKGIVHRDIKPQNIMMFTDGTIKVMDFGIAKFAREEGKTATDQAIGSVHYISPEQASGSVTDAKSDIYSVGAMMYEMLTGKKPFDSDNPVAIAVMHMHDIPERPRAVNPAIPDGLEEIVLRAMEKAPEDRYQTTAEMISDIEAFKADPSRTFGYYQEEDEPADGTINFSVPSAAEIQPESPAEAESPYAPKSAAYAGAAAGAAAAAAYQGGQQSKRYAAPPQKPAYADGYYADNEYDDDEEEEERSSLVVPVLTAVVVVVIVVAVIFIALMFSDMIKNNKKSSADYTMPNFINMDYNEALSAYGDKIKFEVVEKAYNELEEGRIYEQDIEEGKEFNKGDTLKVKVSTGPETVEVPPLEKMNQQLAKDQLTKRGLKFSVTSKTDPNIEEGNVISTDPPAGTMVHKGQTIQLVVSSGVNKGTIKVKDYTNMDIEDAAYAAGYVGLTVDSKPEHSYEKENKVIRQSIEKDTMVDEGTTIILYYSDGQSPEGEINFTVKFPSNSDGQQPNGRYVIDFIIQEEGNMHTVSTPTIILPAYSEHTQTIKGAGENVKVKAVITNLNNNKNATLGNYIFNFADQNITTESESVEDALRQVDAYPAATTEPTTEAPTETPTETTKPTDPPTEPTVKVENFVGRDYNEAVAYFQNNGVYVDIAEQQYSDVYPSGAIISQNPSWGEVKKGDRISVVVSNGPETVWN